MNHNLLSAGEAFKRSTENIQDFQKHLPGELDKIGTTIDEAIDHGHTMAVVNGVDYRLVNPVEEVFVNLGYTVKWDGDEFDDGGLFTLILNWSTGD